MEFAQQIAGKLNIRVNQVEAVLALFAEGATIPFIARYRKDKTGGLDEVQIQQVKDEAAFLKEFTERKAFIEKTISEQGKMTPEIEKLLNEATTVAALEDVYLPYKPKRKTKAMAAREKGLQPLADRILQQDNSSLEELAAAFINEAVPTMEDALQGARDIIAETVNEDLQVREKLRNLFKNEATLQSKVVPGKEEEGQKYKDYFNFSEPISKVPSHRILAVLRGFLEGFLRIAISPEEEAALQVPERLYIKGVNATGEQVRKAIKDAWRRQLQPSLETEYRTELKQKADEESITVFA